MAASQQAQNGPPRDSRRPDFRRRSSFIAEDAPAVRGSEAVLAGLGASQLSPVEWFWSAVGGPQRIWASINVLYFHAGSGAGHEVRAAASRWWMGQRLTGVSTVASGSVGRPGSPAGK